VYQQIKVLRPYNSLGPWDQESTIVILQICGKYGKVP